MILCVWVFSRPSLESAHIVYAQTHWLDLLMWHHLDFRGVREIQFGP